MYVKGTWQIVPVSCTSLPFEQESRSVAQEGDEIDVLTRENEIGPTLLLASSTDTSKLYKLFL